MQTDHDNVLNRFNATWTQIATTFEDEPSKVTFESVNEPQFDGATDAQKAQLINELNTSFHTIVRGSGGNNATRLLVLPTLGDTPDQNLMDALNGELSTMIVASWTSRSGTASSDVVFLPKAGTITSQTLTLNPNGTTFQGLRQGSTDLVRGTDYTISGDQLTLAPSLLTRLAGNRDYGVNASLQARFSQGAPWPVDIRTYDTPVLSNATGTTTSFAIPAQFRGDLSATMESKYADGSNAGSATWTPYQIFRDAWYPDTNANANAINLTADFLNALNDGARVTLTFHYWSGAAVNYYVTKSGSSVTGTTS